MPAIDSREARPVARALAVRHVREMEAGLAERLNALVRQLSSRSPGLTEESLQRLLDSDSSALFVAERGGAIVGTLCLVVFRCPTGRRAFVEDVVVDAPARRTGVAEALTRAAIDLARHEGARTIDLSCRPERLAANALYRKLGFQVRATNFYRLECA